MDNDSSTPYVQQNSDRPLDSFKPQAIHLVDDNRQSQKYLSSFIESPCISIHDGNKEITQQKSLFKRNKTREKQMVYNTIQVVNNNEYQRKSADDFLKLIYQKKLIKTFINKLKQRAYLYPSYLMAENLKYFLKEQYISGRQKNISEAQGTQNVEQFPVLNPSSLSMLIWTLIKVIQLFLVLGWAPFKISFEPDFQNSFTLEIVILVIFFGDMIIKLNKGVIDQGMLVIERNKILKYYVKQELYYDFINIVTTILLMQEQCCNQYFLLVCLTIIQYFITLWKFHSILLKYQETLDFGSSINEIVNLIDLAVLIFFFAHFMACSWYFVGNMSKNYSQRNWIDNYQLGNQSIATLYCYSFYWATMTMVTVGYGDFTGQNVYEVLSSIVMMFGASVIFAYSLNSIGNILNNLNQSNYTYKKKLLLINSYMNQNNVSLELQNRVRNYLKFYLDEEKVGSQNEIQQILDTLSETLQQELLFDVQSKAIKQSKFLQMHFSQNTLRKISLNLTLKSYVPGEQIYKQNSEDQSLYIIQKGQVQLIDEPSGKLLKTYNGGESFGEYELLVGDNRKSTAISNSFAQIYILNKSDFNNSINENQDDFQRYCQLRDKLKLDYTQQFLKCDACTQCHLIQECPYLHYKPDLEILIKREGFLIQKRRHYQRRKFDKTNSIHKLEEIQRDAVRILENLNLSSLQHPFGEEKTSSRYLDEKYEKYPSQNSDNFPAVSPGLKSIHLHRDSKIGEEQVLQNTPQFQPSEKHQFTQILQPEDRTIVNIPKRHSIGFLPQTKILLNAPQSPFNINELKLFSQQIVQVPSQDEARFCQLDEYQQLQFQNCDIDKCREFHNYFPQNNVSEVIKLYSKAQQFMKKLLKQFISNRYRFYRFQAQMRKAGNNRDGTNIKVN